MCLPAAATLPRHAGSPPTAKQVPKCLVPPVIAAGVLPRPRDRRHRATPHPSPTAVESRQKGSVAWLLPLPFRRVGERGPYWPLGFSGRRIHGDLLSPALSSLGGGEGGAAANCAGTRRGQRRQPPPPVLVILQDRLPPVAPIQHLINRPSLLNAQLPSPEPCLASPRLLAQAKHYDLMGDPCYGLSSPPPSTLHEAELRPPPLLPAKKSLPAGRG